MKINAGQTFRPANLKKSAWAAPDVICKAAFGAMAYGSGGAAVATLGSLPASAINLHQAYELLGCPKAWRTVAGTDDCFREPGALDDAADLAVAWFQAHLTRKLTA